MVITGIRSFADVVAEYQAEGFEVEQNPPAEHLPEQLRPFHPAAIARRWDRTVVIEHRSRKTLADSDRTLKEMAKLGVTVDLVVN